MSKHKEIEVIARGVCVRNGQILLCHSKGKKNTYLPGGHIEFHEAARESLRRELEEELGIKAKVGRFLGGIEHTYFRSGKRICELNIVFEYSAPGLTPAKEAPSQEDYIEFYWVPLKKLGRSHLEPWPLRKILPMWMKKGGGGERWVGTIGLKA